ncbi:aminobenzoyl-glutamate utilization protein B [Agrobacterium rubi TR3 = NBRC 13261]|uniref:Aminobenzoyl-glutamate utilization protein B n=1 Tax=Agrobacterium rubi TR3 = NBRC 13261 TaxID=1368415 RepID=A0A081CS59_9HYPH|nr:M20 family metallopeptidase [Agrobacterium rubi]MBP1878982.1 aminobenzoyl-glutamate utilization protein B [Agrobacterium rubi]GAK69505.1 aminobenzoyl-glutamate utilization protein B [Agrobacterium rubi TR3 = NBRC 13261]
MQNSEPIWDFVDQHRPEFEALSDRVWGMPEIAYTEYSSVAEHTTMLREQGFRVTENVAGIPTAVMGEAGEGGPIIAILGEYDALPGLSQEAGIAEPKPLPGNGHGHGCGHNLLGSAAMLAATAIKDWLAQSGKPGRVRYYGCPAEEGGAAKSFMAREGAFDGVDAAITWHPSAFTEVAKALSLANTRMDFRFTGRSSHAAAAPHLGRSALDAVELMNVGVNYLREHVPDSSRIHYAMLDSGGIAPNVVQAKAAVRYAIRSRDLKGMLDLNERVKKVALGAAMMTETTVDISIMSAVSNLLANRPLEEAMQRNLERLGPVPFDADDKAFAAQIQATLSEEDVDNAYLRVGLPCKENTPLCDFIVPLDVDGEPMIGSTDVGDVSWLMPTVQAHAATIAIGTPGHSWQVTAQGKTPAAHKGMTHAAKMMAGTAIDLFTDADLLAAAKADHQARVGKTAYVCPIPQDVQPPLQPRPNVAA